MSEWPNNLCLPAELAPCVDIVRVSPGGLKAFLAHPYLDIGLQLGHKHCLARPRLPSLRLGSGPLLRLYAADLASCRQALLPCCPPRMPCSSCMLLAEQFRRGVMKGMLSGSGAMSCQNELNCPQNSGHDVPSSQQLLQLPAAPVSAAHLPASGAQPLQQHAAKVKPHPSMPDWVQHTMSWAHGLQQTA